MPHQIIEYSDNVGAVLDIDGLVEALHNAAAQQEALPVKGLRTRAFATSQYRVADVHPDNAYIACYLRIGAGRDEAVKVALGKTLFDCLAQYSQSAFDRSPLALSYEIQEIDPTTRWNKNNLDQFMQERQS